MKTLRATDMNEKEREILQRIANLAWMHYQEPGAKKIYALLRDELRVYAGRSS